MPDKMQTKGDHIAILHSSQTKNTSVAASTCFGVMV